MKAKATRCPTCFRVHKDHSLCRELDRQGWLEKPRVENPDSPRRSGAGAPRDLERHPAIDYRKPAPKR